jgi:hypothetical protein
MIWGYPRVQKGLNSFCVAIFCAPASPVKRSVAVIVLNSINGNSMIQERLYFYEIFAERLLTRHRDISDFTVNCRSLKIPSYLRSTLETGSVHRRVAILLRHAYVRIKLQQSLGSNQMAAQASCHKWRLKTAGHALIDILSGSD